MAAALSVSPLAAAMGAAVVMSAPSPSATNGLRNATADAHVASCSPRVALSSFHVVRNDLRRARVTPIQRRSILSFTARSASPDLNELEQKIEESIQQAEEACKSGTDGECRAAWDEVEELSAELSHKAAKVKVAKGDPLEMHCLDNPNDRECKVFDD